MISLSVLILIFLSVLYLKISSIKKAISYIDVAWFGVFGYLFGLIIYGISSNKSQDEYYLFLLTISLLSFLSMTLNSVLMSPLTSRIEIVDELDISATLLNIIIIGIVLFNIGFCYIVITSLLPLVLGSFIDGQGTVLLSLRKAIASGEFGYFAPGLVRQIRDILGPALVAYIITKGDIKNRKIKLLLVIATTLIAMLVSGQRSPILVLALVIAFSYIGKQEVISKKFLISISFIALILIQGLNFMLGRANDLSFFSLVSPVVGIIERIFVVVPKENYLVMPFVSEIPVESFQLWLDDLKIILPINTGQSFSNILHSKLGGSTQGNSVLGLPLDNYLNAGIAGVLVIPFLYVLFLFSFEYIVKKINVTIINKISLVILVNIPFTYSPYYFLLNGALWIIVCFPFLVLARKIRIKKIYEKNIASLKIIL